MHKPSASTPTSATQAPATLAQQARVQAQIGAHWPHIEAGVRQRAQLLTRVLADIYGAQQLIRQALIAPALVHGHPGYLRAMHGVIPAGASHLHSVAFDLALAPEGHWLVEAQHTQTPPLASDAHRWIDALKALSPAARQTHVALLTPGPTDARYGEHAQLARTLALTLVEGGDLTVREQALFVRTLRGLVPVHVLLKQLGDADIDPLELRADSTTGIAGLLQAVRAGHVVMANAPGSAFLESPAWQGFLPAICQHLLGQPLLLPARDTWWCGEAAARRAALPRLAELVISPTYPDVLRPHAHTPHIRTQHAPLLQPLHADALSRTERDAWAQRITDAPACYTLQASIPAHAPRLRVLALREGPDVWHVLRLDAQADGLAPTPTPTLTSHPHANSRQQHNLASAPVSPAQPLLTRRAAENLYWLGRYSERCELRVRLMRLCLEVRHAPAPASTHVFTWLQTLTHSLGMLDAPVMHTHALIRTLREDTATTRSLWFHLQSWQQTAVALRERLASEHWQAIVHCTEQFSADSTPPQGSSELTDTQALHALHTVHANLQAIHHTHSARADDRLLMRLGRHVERLGFLANALDLSLQSVAPTHDSTHASALCALFDTPAPVPAQSHNANTDTSLMTLLVHDADSPHTLSWLTQALREDLHTLAQSTAAPHTLAQLVPELFPELALSETTHLRTHLAACMQAAWQVSDAITARYFSHTDHADSVGA